MSLRDKLSRNMVKEISSLKDSEFDDFQVEVEGKIFTCHSFVLLSCSEFFRGMLRSNMREKQDRTVRLTNISAATFQLILDTLYTGDDMLTTDNLIDAWYAVDQLQITRLMEYCEDYAVANLTLDNLELYKWHANFLHSERAQSGILKFIIKNFSAIRETELFRNLEIKDLMTIIESEHLVVVSEDLVMYTIFDWVQYGETPVTTNEPISFINNRKKYLHPLLLKTRCNLCSKLCLQYVFESPLAKDESAVKEILFKSLFLKDRPGFGFVESSIHRASSKCIHCFMYFSQNHGIKITNIKDGKEYFSQLSPACTPSYLFYFENSVFGVIKHTQSVDVGQIYKDNWLSLKSMRFKMGDRCNFVIVLEEEVHVFFENKVRTYNRNTGLTTSRDCPNDYIGGFCHYHHCIIFKAIHGLTEILLWKPLDNSSESIKTLDFEMNNFTHFHHELNTYIMDQSGRLFKLTQNLDFIFVERFWSMDVSIAGALIFHDTLKIFVDEANMQHLSNVSNNVSLTEFQKIEVIMTKGRLSNVINIIVEKSILLC